MLTTFLNFRVILAKFCRCKIYFLLFIFILFYFIFIYNIAQAYNNVSNEEAQLTINIDEKNNITGTVTVNFKVQPKEVTNSYIILPFLIDRNKLSFDPKYVTVSPSSDSNYTIMDLIIKQNPPNKIDVSFPILPSPFNNSETNSDLDRSADFLSIETRPDGGFVFHFRFDTQIPDQYGVNPFGSFTDLAPGMIKLSQIIVILPSDATLYTIPPHNQPSSINDGPHPGTLPPNKNVFTTSTDFYQGQHLWINYKILSLLSPTSSNLLPLPLPVIFILIVQALSLLIPGIGGLPATWLNENSRFGLSISILVAIPIMVLAIIFWSGTNFLKDPTLLELLIPGAVTYLIMVIILIPHTIEVLKHLHPQTQVSETTK